MSSATMIERLHTAPTAAASAAAERLSALALRFVSATYGAGCGTRHRTHATVRRLLEETALTPAAHLTCVGASREEVDEVARAYYEAGVRHIVAPRGDPPDAEAGAGAGSWGGGGSGGPRRRTARPGGLWWESVVSPATWPAIFCPSPIHIQCAAAAAPPDLDFEASIGALAPRPVGSWGLPSRSPGRPQRETERDLLEQFEHGPVVVG